MFSLTRSFLFLLGALSLVAADSATGQCGPSGGGLTCNTVGTTNKCCSSMGWCGDSSAHCDTGCQSQFGVCFHPVPHTEQLILILILTRI